MLSRACSSVRTRTGNLFSIDFQSSYLFTKWIPEFGWGYQLKYRIGLMHMPET